MVKKGESIIIYQPKRSGARLTINAPDGATVKMVYELVEFDSNYVTVIPGTSVTYTVTDGTNTVEETVDVNEDTTIDVTL